jgi:hypothetical protein
MIRHGFSATILPLFHTYTGVPYIRAVFRASFPARRRARPTPAAKSSGRAAFVRVKLAPFDPVVLRRLLRQITLQLHWRRYPSSKSVDSEHEVVSIIRMASASNEQTQRHLA